MALRYDIIATVTAIIFSCSSSLQAGVADSFDAAANLAADPPITSSIRKKPEVSCELKVREKYRYYDIDGTDVVQLRKQMKRNGTKWDDGKVYAAVTSWDIRYSYDVSHQDGKCSVKSVKTDVDIVYQLPRRVSVVPDPELTALWDDYIVRLKEHEFGHKELAVKTAAEINQVLASLEGFSSRRELDREVDRLTDERFRRLKKHQVEYDDETRHGETQGAVLREREAVHLAGTPGADQGRNPEAPLAATPVAVLSNTPGTGLSTGTAAVLAANTPGHASGTDHSPVTDSTTLP